MKKGDAEGFFNRCEKLKFLNEKGKNNERTQKNEHGDRTRKKQRLQGFKGTYQKRTTKNIHDFLLFMSRLRRYCGHDSRCADKNLQKHKKSEKSELVFVLDKHDCYADFLRQNAQTKRHASKNIDRRKLRNLPCASDLRQGKNSRRKNDTRRNGQNHKRDDIQIARKLQSSDRFEGNCRAYVRRNSESDGNRAGNGQIENFAFAKQASRVFGTISRLLEGVKMKKTKNDYDLLKSILGAIFPKKRTKTNLEEDFFMRNLDAYTDNELSHEDYMKMNGLSVQNPINGDKLEKALRLNEIVAKSVEHASNDHKCDFTKKTIKKLKLLNNDYYPEIIANIVITLTIFYIAITGILSLYVFTQK